MKCKKFDKVEWKQEKNSRALLFEFERSNNNDLKTEKYLVSNMNVQSTENYKQN